ncbi:YceI family protein [Pedobacter boryungensis]|uniref:YceI family protein n=1 Tax=Pedobacter boryungensis TaxID=869962 RepID=A0ABX2D930_9SPHI|nr:YceI family protein [Pedobacter boryungensis]NQX30572.1 YceI family protein [Pedobacter boryungensis]
MYNKLPLNYLLIITTTLSFACSRPIKEEKKNNANASANPVSLHVGDEKYVPIDTKESVVVWRGAMQIGANAHTGYVYFSKGELKVEDNQLIGGTLEVDMNTIEDNKHGKNNGLINHLKNPDFFDVKNFPTATITITAVEPLHTAMMQITGDLTIKGITRPVTFTAQVQIKDGVVNASGKLNIDRTEWGIRYKSGKFLENLADQTISDTLEFDIKVVAKHK